MFDRLWDGEGRTSYEVLADETNALPRSDRLVDLACGDGFLLALLAQRGFANLVGVDRSPEELAAARTRLGPLAELHCQDAGALPLPVGSVDTVVCHMALMLFSPVEPALAEIARILKPGAKFIAVLNRPFQHPILEIYRRELTRVTAETGLGPLRLGDPRIFTIDGMSELVRSRPFEGQDLHVRDFEVGARLSPSGVWSVLGSMYDAFRLPAPAQAILGERLVLGWQSLADDTGRLDFRMGMRLLRCRAPASSGSP